MLSPGGVARSETVRVNKSSYNAKLEEVTIRGEDFGTQCQGCEVLADYGRFSYSLPIKKWRKSEIIADVPNFGVDSASLSLVTKGTTVQLADQINIKRLIVPKRTKSLVRQGQVPGLQMFEFESEDRLGNKGVHKYKVQKKVPACNARSLVFHDAQLQIGKRTRFAKAAINRKPRPGCKNCSPVEVKYYVEPTGFLHYQLHIYKERVDGICKDRLR